MQSLKTALDELLNNTAHAGSPACALLFAKDGEVLYRAAAGMADLEQGRAAQADDSFIIASNTKQFACMAILMLRDRGLLSLDEPVARFFPDFPPYRENVTVRMLMCHTSGIREYFEGGLNDDRLRTAHTEDVLELIRGFGPETDFVPGTHWSYCNSGYVMLGDIVRQLSGKPFGAFVEQEIFAPLGMCSSHAPDTVGPLDPKQAAAYVDAEAVPEVNAPPATRFVRQPYDMIQVGYADGNIASTLDDLLRWHHFLYETDGTALLGPGSLREMFVPYPGTNYALGLFLGPQENSVPYSAQKREIWHTGSVPGFISRMSRFPDEGVSAILLTNWGGIERDRLFFSALDELFRRL